MSNTRNPRFVTLYLLYLGRFLQGLTKRLLAYLLLSIYPTYDTKLNTLVRASSVSVGVGEIYRFNYVGCSQYEVMGFNRASLIWYSGVM